MKQFVIAIDNGTTSTRAIVFDRAGKRCGIAQKETTQFFPHSGWVEHDAAEIWVNTLEVITGALADAKVSASDIAAVGITNQRETTIVWDRATGVPIYNAIVWQDTRTQSVADALTEDEGINRFAELTGLPLTAYFSATKIAWILDNVPGARTRAEAGELAFGTPDTWLLWNLTGGVNGGVHATDVTNASRTLLMSLAALEWDNALLDVFRVPSAVLPQIRSSSEIYGTAVGPLEGVPVSGILGDQQAATFGQVAFDSGETKSTYGTGCFLIMNTGTDIVHSQTGLITTVAYKIGAEPAHYALEGSIAVAGSLVQWLRDNLGLISDAREIEALATSVEDSGGAVIVPAFSGLFAPYWRTDARGVIVGLTRFINRAHLARAALESTALQTRDVVDAMSADTGVTIPDLRVDGGMVMNNFLMQYQADILGIPVVRPSVSETTALGAAFAAGLAVGFWKNTAELRTLWTEDARWNPAMPEVERERQMRVWRKAVSKSLDWIDDDSPAH
jgi:glycerol kinase